MQVQPTKKNIQSAPREVGTALLCIFLVLFMLFEVVLVSFSITRSFPERGPERPNQLPQSGIQNQNPTPQPANPIFANGVIPSGLTGVGTTLGSEVLSQYAILIDAQTGEIVAQKQADAQFDPASMAKIMTMILLCEGLSRDDLTREIEMTKDITDYVTTGIYEGADVSLIKMDNGHNIYVGDTFPIKDLLYAVGVSSAADCTMMLVQELCPAATIEASEQAFVVLMNQKAQALGLTATSFDNAVGLEGEGTKSSATDMARLLSYALQCDLIKTVLSVNPEHVFNNDWVDNGETKYYNVYLKSTLFYHRMNAYKTNYQQTFSLGTATLNGGKTGRLTDESGNLTKTSTLACWLTEKSSGKTYILVTAGCGQMHWTMKDIKTIADTYLK